MAMGGTKKRGANNGMCYGALKEVREEVERFARGVGIYAITFHSPLDIRVPGTATSVFWCAMAYASICHGLSQSIKLCDFRVIFRGVDLLVFA